MPRRRTPVIGALFAAAIGVAASALAAPPPTRAPAMQKVLDCKAVTDATQRLACYDAAVAAMETAEKTGDLVTIDREQRRTVRRQAFGLQLPSLAMFDRGEKPEEADRITVKLAKVSRMPHGQWVVTLDDGAVWRQTDDEELLKAPRPGSTAEIRKGVLGAFFMKIDGQSAIRVHRDS